MITLGDQKFHGWAEAIEYLANEFNRHFRELAKHLKNTDIDLSNTKPEVDE